MGLSVRTGDRKMANSIFTIQLTFDGPNQSTADAKRNDALVDFAKSMNLDIYTDASRQTVDQTKVAPAVRAAISAFIKSRVIRQRAESARAATITAEETTLGTL